MAKYNAYNSFFYRECRFFLTTTILILVLPLHHRNKVAKSLAN